MIGPIPNNATSRRCASRRPTAPRNPIRAIRARRPRFSKAPYPRDAASSRSARESLDRNGLRRGNSGVGPGPTHGASSSGIAGACLTCRKRSTEPLPSPASDGTG